MSSCDHNDHGHSLLWIGIILLRRRVRRTGLARPCQGDGEAGRREHTRKS